MERIMHERGDLKMFHEPFLYLYYVHDAKKKLAFFHADPGAPASYSEIKNTILAAAEEGPVFVKDMCYYVADYILQDPEFLQRIQSTFLVRDPKKAITSYYRLDPELTSEEVGLESQYYQFERTAEVTGRTPLVVDAEDLLADTERFVRAYCAAVGLPFLEHSLRWSGEIPPEWQHVAGWHTAVSSSDGIKSAKRKEINFATEPKLQSLYEHHLPFYEKLKHYRLAL